jgi:hypothetical protein
MQIPNNQNNVSNYSMGIYGYSNVQINGCTNMQILNNFNYKLWVNMGVQNLDF